VTGQTPMNVGFFVYYGNFSMEPSTREFTERGLNPSQPVTDLPIRRCTKCGRATTSASDHCARPCGALLSGNLLRSRPRLNVTPGLRPMPPLPGSNSRRRLALQTAPVPPSSGREMEFSVRAFFSPMPPYTPSGFERGARRQTRAVSDAHELGFQRFFDSSQSRPKQSNPACEIKTGGATE
jgi:hypothetical protein